MSRLFFHSAVPDCVPLLQNIHHPEEGRQQEEADQERELQEKWNKTGEFPSSFLHTKYSGAWSSCINVWRKKQLIKNNVS